MYGSQASSAEEQMTVVGVTEGSTLGSIEGVWEGPADGKVEGESYGSCVHSVALGGRERALSSRWLERCTVKMDPHGSRGAECPVFLFL
jgi:hypothetical protein